MRDRDATAGKRPNGDFRAAIAQWQLDLRTEIKRWSSLPTAMFDACDPMLETRLAETAKDLLARLHQPDAAITDLTAVATEQRIESVQADELRALPHRIAAGECTGLDLGTGLPTEYLAILTDTCCHATGTAQQGAAQLLARDFGVSLSTDLHGVTTALAQRGQDCIDAADAAAADQALSDICERIRSAMTLHRAACNQGRGNP